MPTPASAEIELIQFLKAVEDGSVSLTPELEPQDVYAGNVSYTASNSWRIVVYKYNPAISYEAENHRNRPHGRRRLREQPTSAATISREASSRHFCFCPS
jgi:hypothetical protein